MPRAKNSDKPHYHFLILLNRKAFHRLGRWEKSAWGGCQDNTLIHAAIRAWSQAIEHPVCKTSALVEIAKEWEQGRRTKKYFHRMLLRNDPDTFAEVMYAASYLCKYHSKRLGQWVHCFGASQKPLHRNACQNVQ
ncbi:YagK/YfjJ domain-containing protein [Vreelandella titanicae]|uniref:YagK/YfjJ domain-containing protein n=1 Tax=Vreelandella titanicae TaxID=664683 RepID=UPI003D26A8E1